MKFKKGDRVRYITKDWFYNLPDNHTGTIKCIEPLNEVQQIGVEWDEPWHKGHDLSGEIIGNRGLWVKEEDIELIQPPALDNLVISIPTQEEWDKVMRVLEDMGVRWNSSEYPTKNNYWNEYEKLTAIHLIQNKIYGYCDLLYYKEFYSLHTFITAQEFLEGYGGEESAPIEVKKINTPSEKPEGIKKIKNMIQELTTKIKRKFNEDFQTKYRAGLVDDCGNRTAYGEEIKSECIDELIKEKELEKAKEIIAKSEEEKKK